MQTTTASLRKGSLLLLLLALATGELRAQQSGELLTEAIARHGGTAVRTVQTLRLEGEISSRDGKKHVVVSADLDGYVRYDFGSPVTESRVDTPDGQVELRGSQFNPKPPHVGLFGGLDVLSILGLRRLETAGTRWKNPEADTQSGRAAVRLKGETSEQRTFYGRVLRNEPEIRIDSETGLVASIERQQAADKSLDLVFPVRYVFSDYRQTGGLLFPFRIEKLVGGRVAETLTVSSVELNPALPRSLFGR